MWEEAEITINGTRVTSSMSMTIRVALESFAKDINTNGLGNDSHGRSMTQLYNERISEIRELLYNKAK